MLIWRAKGQRVNAVYIKINLSNCLDADWRVSVIFINQSHASMLFPRKLGTFYICYSFNTKIKMELNLSDIKIHKKASRSWILVLFHPLLTSYQMLIIRSDNDNSIRVKQTLII